MTLSTLPLIPSWYLSLLVQPKPAGPWSSDLVAECAVKGNNFDSQISTTPLAELRAPPLYKLPIFFFELFHPLLFVDFFIFFPLVVLAFMFISLVPFFNSSSVISFPIQSYSTSLRNGKPREKALNSVKRNVMKHIAKFCGFGEMMGLLRMADELRSLGQGWKHHQAGHGSLLIGQVFWKIK